MKTPFLTVLTAVICTIDLVNAACSSHCLNSTVCHQSDEHCEQGCEDGWFGALCNETCSTGCLAHSTLVNATCSQDNGYCDLGCLTDYYGESCTEPCSKHCKAKASNISPRTCNETTGYCVFSCVNGYYGEKCMKQCSAGCVANITSEIPNDATVLPVCDPSNGVCSFGCDNGSYFSNCTGKCSPHCLKNNSSDIRRCSEKDGHCEFGCEDGYFGFRCESECNRNCRASSTSNPRICDPLTGSCILGCMDGFHGQMCDQPCHHLCMDNLCSRNGCCIECKYTFRRGCKCDEDCPVGCKGFQSNQHCFQNKTCREGCDVDYWGPTCDPCSPGCMDLLPTETSNCNVTDGVCTAGCKAGAYGLTCWEICPSECKNNVCNRTSGECLEKCNTGYYGNYCNNTCSDNCPENDCFQENGTCVGEKCLWSEYVAWYGPSCEHRCPANCLDTVCDRDTGSCTNGCIEGYFGEKCLNGCLEGTYGRNCDRNCSLGCANDTCQPNTGHCICVTSYIGAACDSMEISPNMRTEFPIISVAVGGVALVLLIIGIARLIVWRNKKMKEIQMRRKPKNRRGFSELIRITIASFKNIGGPKRILVDNLLTRVKEMLPEEFETDFNEIEATQVIKSISVAREANNMSKNCFADVYPYDENRVVLRPFQQTVDNMIGPTERAGYNQTYINASFIEGYASSKQRYIASQGPIVATTNDFWKMVFQEKVSVIVMLSEIEEKMFKKYWPDVDSQSIHGEFTVYCQKEEFYSDFSIRRLNIKYLDETRPVQHLQFTSWPFESPPASAAGFIEFYHKFLAIEPEEDTPTVVHCTSGAGKTGCFIALDISVDEGNEDHSVNVSHCVTRLREQRMKMVRTEEQYVFVYKTIAQVLSSRTYPVGKERFKTEWKELKKDDGKVVQKVYEDLCESLILDEKDIESIDENQAEEGKNREGSNIPEDRYRPKLKNGNYINAVYIDTYKKKNGMIVTERPTLETINDFFRLLLQEECHVVVMMNEENWDDKTQVQFWSSLDKPTQFGDICVETTDILDESNYLSIQLKLSDLTREGDHKFTLHLYVCTIWKSDKTCPKNELSCLSLVTQVLQETGESYTGRILVHCLTGSERSGLFCAIYILLEKLNYEEKISVVNTVRKIKSRQANAIPNLDQFRFIYECLLYYIENFETQKKVQKRSRASNVWKRISLMYSQSDEKKKKGIKAKPDKEKKGTEEDDKDILVTEESETSGSHVQDVFAVVDKKGKDEKANEEVIVTIELNSNGNDINVI